MLTPLLRHLVNVDIICFSTYCFPISWQGVIHVGTVRQPVVITAIQPDSVAPGQKCLATCKFQKACPEYLRVRSGRQMLHSSEISLTCTQRYPGFDRLGPLFCFEVLTASVSVMSFASFRFQLRPTLDFLLTAPGSATSLIYSTTLNLLAHCALLYYWV
jgi:hypothetical protein